LLVWLLVLAKADSERDIVLFPGSGYKAGEMAVNKENLPKVRYGFLRYYN
jgi:hypothetical protein